MPQPKTDIELVVVGDRAVGKSCLLFAYVFGIYPKGDFELDPTGTGIQAHCVGCDGVQVNLTLWEPPSNDDYKGLRLCYYHGADGFLLCFSVDNDRSYENIATKWHPEIRHLCTRTPIVLVGTKTDLRDGASTQPGERFISQTMGKELAAKIEAASYVECSAKEMSGVKEVYEEFVRVVQCQNYSKPKANMSRKHSFCHCVLL